MTTRFIDVPDLAHLVNSIGVEGFIRELAEYIRADFGRWGEFDKAPRVANYFPYGVIELMPTSDGSHYGFKYVTGHPQNTGRELLTVMAFGAFAINETGFPLLVAEFTLCTAFRTAATSALVAKALARPESRSMAIIGCGAQSEFQALGFKSLLGIEEIRIFDIDPAAMTKFAHNMIGVDGLTVIPANSVQEAVLGADIVTLLTADKHRASILTPSLVEPGMHINAVGGDCPGKTELDSGVLNEAKIFVEFEPQTRIEGDIQQLSPESPVTEVWRVLEGSASGRESDQDVTIFDSVGFAVEDFATLRYLFDLAEAQDVGKKIVLVPELKDPKDLYGSLRIKTSLE